jgi:hypothetical protein
LRKPPEAWNKNNFLFNFIRKLFLYGAKNQR